MDTGRSFLRPSLLVLIVLACASATVTGQVRGTLNVRLNAGGYAVGQTMTVSAALAPGATIPVDAYIVLRLPSGEFRSLQLGGGLVAGIQPIARGIVPFAFDGPVAQLTFSATDPIGAYTWFAVLTDPGTANFVSPLSQTPFTVGGQGPPTATQPVPPTGGTVTLPNVATVAFPPGSFDQTASVSLATTTSPQTATVFNESAAIFRPGSRLQYEVRINTGATPPVSDVVQVAITVPDSLLQTIPSNYQFDIFAQVYQDGGMESLDTFQLFAGTLDVPTKTVRASLPTQIFTNRRTQDGSWEAVLTIAPTPGPPRALMNSTITTLAEIEAAVLEANGQCQGASIACPLAGFDCQNSVSPNGHYQPAGRTSSAGTRPHYGTDFAVPEGTRINAASDGVVEESYRSTSYGETIILRHDDGSATLYAHLQTRSVPKGQRMQRGVQIGLSGNTGQSRGAHLHLEYVPNGQIIQSRNRIDPNACTGTTQSGSITVRDNGSLADDAFEVFLDNIRLGATTIGGTNTLAVNNLVSGNHNLRVVCTVAPDNVGTLQVTLSRGLTFQGGSTSRSATLTRGGSVTYVIVVP